MSNFDNITVNYILKLLFTVIALNLYSLAEEAICLPELARTNALYQQGTSIE